MAKFSVTYMLPSTGSADIAEVEAAEFRTQATNGAGLVADFYGSGSASRPSDTFSNVISVQQVREEPSGGGGGLGTVPWVQWPKKSEKR